MANHADLIAIICELAEKDPDAAGRRLEQDYPFIPAKPPRRSFTNFESITVITRDGFIDRYTGERLVHPGALHMLSLLLPEQFPYHPHGKRDQCHVAHWELWPTLDHIIPLALGGEDDISNLATTSMFQNLAKANATLEQLGWSLHEPQPETGWDGLSSWFIRMYEVMPEAQANGHLSKWYHASKRVLGDDS